MWTDMYVPAIRHVESEQKEGIVQEGLCRPPLTSNKGHCPRDKSKVRCDKFNQCCIESMQIRDAGDVPNKEFIRLSISENTAVTRFWVEAEEHKSRRHRLFRIRISVRTPAPEIGFPSLIRLDRPVRGGGGEFRYGDKEMKAKSSGARIELTLRRGRACCLKAVGFPSARRPAEMDVIELKLERSGSALKIRKVVQTARHRRLLRRRRYYKQMEGKEKGGRKTHQKLHWHSLSLVFRVNGASKHTERCERAPEESAQWGKAAGERTRACSRQVGDIDGSELKSEVAKEEEADGESRERKMPLTPIMI
ncbi:hypothetical protein B0H11DRAFT_1931514 [Mycena galericulata]|nr:hypothetical protein B0H11DRAFT_1931514 [Mycena galericulata]